MKKNNRRKMAMILFVLALIALPLASSIVESTTSNAWYALGAATDDNFARDFGTIFGGSYGILGALGVLCGVQTAIGLGVGL